MKSLRAVIALALVLGFAAASAHAQGVGINATGAAADTSAILDLSATNKGFLPPRMGAAQRSAIVLPATGLLVYQTDGTQGLYYNTGTPAAPNWRLVGDAANAGPWSLNGTSAYYNGGNVGIGTPSPTHPLNVVSNLNGLRVQTTSSGGAAVSVGGFGTVGVDAPFVANGRFALLENGNLGLGVANPASKLSFAATAGKKISLYPAGANDYGFGVSAGRLQIFNDGTPGGDVAIGTDAAGTFTERLAVKNNGALAVNGNAGSPGQVLQSNGAGAAASWAGPSANIHQTAITNSANSVWVSDVDAPMLIPGLTQQFTVPAQGGQVLVTAQLAVFAHDCVLCAPSSAVISLLVDGIVVGSIKQNLVTEKNSTLHLSQLLTSPEPGTHTVSFTLENQGPGDHNAITVGYLGATLYSLAIVQVFPN